MMKRFDAATVLSLPTGDIKDGRLAAAGPCARPVTSALIPTSVEDACTTTNRVGWEGVDRNAELVKTSAMVRLLSTDAEALNRRPGNE